MSTRIHKHRSVMRKEPKQARSRATVDAIVVAGAHVLEQHGWSGFTTDRVAEVAGASIGSLYQYFPNKLSLIEAIRRRHFDDVIAVLSAVEAGGGSLKKRVEGLVDGMIAVHGSQPALHRALLEEVPRSKEAKAAHAAFDARYEQLYRSVVASVRKTDEPERIATIARTLAAAIEGVVHDAAQHGDVDSPEVRQELVEMAYAYLRRSGRAAGASSEE